MATSQFSHLPCDVVNLILASLPLRYYYRCRAISRDVQETIDSSITELDLSLVKKLELPTVVALASRHPNLTKLVLATANVTPYALVVQKQAWFVDAWYYTSFMRLDASLEKNWLVEIVQANPNIEFLGVQGCQFVHNRSVSGLLRVLPSLKSNLKTLDVVGCVPFLSHDYVTQVHRTHPGLLLSVPAGVAECCEIFAAILARAISHPTEKLELAKKLIVEAIDLTGLPPSITVDDLAGELRDRLEPDSFYHTVGTFPRATVAVVVEPGYALIAQGDGPLSFGASQTAVKFSYSGDDGRWRMCNQSFFSDRLNSPAFKESPWVEIESRMSKAGCLETLDSLEAET